MRLLLDISSLARWTGPPVGITRVEHALASAARRRPGTELIFWDKHKKAFRHLNPAWTDSILGWQAAIDVPEPGQSPLSRHRLFAALEKTRLTRPALATSVERLQAAILAIRPHGHRLRDAQGRRIAHLPPDMALAAPVRIGPEDTILSAGSDWFHLDAVSLAAAKSRHGFRYACLCYDLIPITHPHFYRAEDVALVTRHWRATLPIADRVIVNSRAIARDVENFCAGAAIPSPDLAVLPLGFEPPPANPAPPPAPLEPGRYALFVSTIEPRKGHAMLLRVWRRLLEQCVPQSRDFHLVFVGRPGWMVDDVLADLAAGIENVHHLRAVDDDGLAGLYAHAAFAVYPSQYEGFGLPIIEAMARQKPVLASTGGALPETVAGAYPCLPPDDELAWHATLAEWIARPPAVSEHPPPATWPAAATAILDQAARNRSPAC
jgi:glycosyltransferase involved in cell wall biosynthesis